jgi:hypothetical protein
VKPSAVDLGQKAPELLVTMAHHALADDPAGAHVQRGKQRGGAVPPVIMGPGCGMAGP